MKLTRTDIDRVNGIVRCEVTYNVQNVNITIPFTIAENELISAAINSGRYTWDDIDVKTVGEILLKSSIEI